MKRKNQIITIVLTVVLLALVLMTSRLRKPDRLINRAAPRITTSA